MVCINNIQEISNVKKEKIFEFEKNNIENIEKEAKLNNPIRKSSKGLWETSQYSFNNCVIYELAKQGELKNSTIIVTYGKLKGLCWKDLINIQEDNEDNNELKTNIEQGAWITYFKNKIRYTVSYNKEIIVAIQIEKKKNDIIISCQGKTNQLEKSISQNFISEILLIDVLKQINYDSNQINEFIAKLNKYCVIVNRLEAEKQLLIIEKKELQQNVNILTSKINDITKQIDAITKKASIAEEKTKRTIDEIDRVKTENENLKNSIFNVRKMIAKKSAFIPIFGRLIIKDLNKEFGENALPSGK